MSIQPKDTRVRLVLLLAALLVATVGCVSQPQDNGPFRLRTDRSVVTVGVGGQAVFQALVTGASHRLVKLAVTGAPAGTRTSVRPKRVHSGAPAFVLVQTSSRTPVGTYPLTVRATRGKLTRTATVQLVVTRPGTFTMTLDPASVIVDTGDTATYRLTIQRANVTSPITLGVTGLPPGVTATVSPSLLATGSTATVTVHVGAAAPPGSLVLTVTGRAWRAYASASAYLVIGVHSQPDFPISGTADLAVTPGGPSGAIDLALTNPNGSTMSVTGLTVSVTGTDKAGCGPENYAITQYAGPGTLAVPAGSTRTLADLGVARAQWPQLRMVDLPVNQDACKGAVVSLHYSGTGSGS